MTTDIVKAQSATPAPRPGGALSLGVMSPHEAWMFCESLANTPLLPDVYRKQPASVLWAMEYGRALGLDVVTTITTIHVIKGKPTQSADLMLSRARSAGHRVRIKSERTRCVVTIVRADDPDDVNEIEWTLDDAVTAGLCEIRNNRPYSRSSKGERQSWEKYPRAMLRARAIAECVRIACPEVLHGAIYTPEELGAYVDAEGLPVDAPVTPLQVVQHEVVEPGDTPEAVGSGAVDFAQRATDAETPGRVKELWALAKVARVLDEPVTAPDTGEVCTLRAYLTRRGIALKGDAPASEPGPAAEPTGPAAPDEDEHARAVAELRAFAAEQQIPDIDSDAYGALGVPLEDASAESVRGLLNQLCGSAA